MEKISKTFNVYKFNELSEEIQEEVFNKFYEEEQNSYLEDCLQEDMEEEAKEILKQYFENATFENVWYDLSYSQGSGAMIEFQVDLNDLNKKYKIFSSKEMRFLNNNIDTAITIKKRGSYCHQYSFEIESNVFNLQYLDYEKELKYYNLTKKDFEKLENRLYDFVSDYNIPFNDNIFIKDIISINKDITKIGYELIDGAISKEKLKEVIQEDYRFLKNGEIFE